MSFLSRPLAKSKATYRHLILPQPRFAGPHEPGNPLVVAGMFRTSNGVGRAARNCFNALKDEGHDPVAVDLSTMFNQVEHEAVLPVGQMPKTRRGTLILFANAPETRRALIGLGLRRWHDWRIIGCWAWELPIAPENWVSDARYLSEIWVPSLFVRDSLKYTIGRAVKVVPHHVPIPRHASVSAPDDVPDRPFRFLCMADGRSSFHRKNVKAAVRMFRNAFNAGEDVRLTVKCRNLGLYPSFARDLQETASLDSRIDIIEHTLSDREMQELFEQCDVVVSTHRSEGFGLVMAEAMALGRPVIATGWSGNMQYMTENNSCLLPYSMEPVRDPTGVYAGAGDTEWAVVDEVAGSRAMRIIRDNPQYRYTLGETARYDISKRLDKNIYSRALGLGRVESAAGLMA